MKIEYFHASKYGNEAAVAEEFRRQATGNAISVNVRHIREVTPTELPPADLYVFSSPGRMGKPIRGVRGFLKQLTLPPGSSYAILTTELAPRPPDKRSRLGPTEEQLAMWQRVIPIMSEILQLKGLVMIAEGKVYVNGVTGPLEDGWQKKVASFVARVCASQDGLGDPPAHKELPTVMSAAQPASSCFPTGVSWDVGPWWLSHVAQRITT